MNTFRYRIGKAYFETRDEAEAWAAAGNIGGTYSIIAQVWCNEHKDWFDTIYNDSVNAHICAACHQEHAADWREQDRIESQRKMEQARLAAWNSGAPIKPYVEPVYLHTEELS